MDKQKYLILIYVIITTILFPGTAYPCTTFVLHKGDRLVFGRNLDWYSGTGLVIVNPRNLEKAALVNSSEKPVKWVSKFGSITFNQIGRDLPFGGINESGLVVEHMTLDETVYPSKDNRYVIGAFQWIQFQLDNYSTIEEVMHSDSFLRIEDNSKIHFLICDRLGNSATIEFLDGKMVCHTGKDLPFRVLANSKYEESVSCFTNNFDTKSNPSLQHFCTAAKKINDSGSFTEDSSIDYAFHTLNMVSQELFTKWSIVYDITNMRIYFKVFETPVIDGEKKIFTKQPPYDPITKVVDFKALDFNCSDIVKVFDINSNQDKVVNQYFIPYSTDINKEFINKAFTFYKGWGLNIELKPDEIDYLAKYPESFNCAAGK
jgi:choloylglycine hydrolase